MSDNENEDFIEKPFAVDHPKQGRAACKKCKGKCLSGELRIAKVVKNPFGQGIMKQWYHLSCLFESFLTQRATTKRIESSEEIEGWDDLNQEERDDILKRIDELENKVSAKHGTTKKITPKKPTQSPKVTATTSKSTSLQPEAITDSTSKDNLFREFRRVVANITNESSYLEKTAIVQKMFTKGSDGEGFKGNLVQWCRLLLPSVIKRIYNLQSKQLVKLFSRIFQTDQDDMLEHLEQGDVGETISVFFEKSAEELQPKKKSYVTVQEVDDFLEELSTLTKEEEQMNHFKKFVKKCTSNDLKIVIRLIKHDLRMNAGAKHILEGVHPDAYEAFQSSRDLESVIRRIKSHDSNKQMKATISVMTPVLPMLAEACKSVEQAMKKCPNGMYSEIKYDGERVQVHKHEDEFKYFSRSLKPVMPHKVSHFKDYIPQAFPHAKDLILDSEVLMIDPTNGKPLPFGSLGVHKREEFKNANVCLFVFDCIYINGEILTHKTMKERRRILKANMKEIPNHIMFSEVQEVHKAEDLSKMISKVLNLGLEGLVLKDLKSIYEPGKRHWLKVKKDYLCDGAMADTADLVVLGAWFGTGKKGGMMSVFLMGCYDEYTEKFCTVTKVHTGHDDKTLERLQTELDMIKISTDVYKVPGWLKCTKTMIPDFVAADPKKQPVWEITGAEFTKHDVHTADGISIRFPRVTRIRHDKTWKEATSLNELKILFIKSKENTDYHLILTKNDDTKSVKSNENIKEETSNQINIKKEIKAKEDKVIMEIEKEDSEFKKPKRKSTERILNEKPNKILIMKPEKDFFPTVFKDIKVLLADGIKGKYDGLIRHFIAVGGDVLNMDDKNEATHVIHLNEEYTGDIEKYPTDVRHVTVGWVNDSIAHKVMQETKPYTVCWVPTS